MDKYGSMVYGENRIMYNRVKGGEMMIKDRTMLYFLAALCILIGLLLNLVRNVNNSLNDAHGLTTQNYTVHTSMT